MGLGTTPVSDGEFLEMRRVDDGSGGMPTPKPLRGRIYPKTSPVTGWFHKLPSGVEEQFPVGVKSGYKTSDESVANSTTLQDDDALIISSLAPLSEWIIEFMIVAFSASATPDIKIAITGSSVSRIYSFVHTSGGLTLLTSSGASTNITLPISTDVPILVRTSLATTGSSGNLRLQWAQRVSDATPTTVKIGSLIHATRIS